MVNAVPPANRNINPAARKMEVPIPPVSGRVYWIGGSPTVNVPPGSAAVARGWFAVPTPFFAPK